MKYGKSAKTKETPLLKDQIGLFNDISKYVVAMILNHEAVTNRAAAVKKFVAMSQVCISRSTKKMATIYFKATCSLIYCTYFCWFLLLGDEIKRTLFCRNTSFHQRNSSIFSSVNDEQN